MKSRPLARARARIFMHGLVERFMPWATFARRARTNFPSALALMAQFRWPQWLSLTMLSACLGVWTLIWTLKKTASDLAAETALLNAKNLVMAPIRPPASVPVSLAPSEAQYPEDLRTLFTIAKSNAIKIGLVNYRRDTMPTALIVNRHVEIQTTDDYPRIKAFIASVLTDMPNATLQELRLERQDVQSPQATIQVKFTLLYEDVNMSVEVSP